MMEKEEVRDLLIRYNAGQCTEVERALVERSFMEYNEHGIDIPEDRIVALGEEIRRGLPGMVGPFPFFSRYKGAVAAVAVAAVALLSLGIWLLLSPPSLEVPPRLVYSDVPAGGKRAVLTVEGGGKVELSGTQDGVVVSGGTVSYGDGSVVAGVSAGSGNSGAGYHLLATPRGGEYSVTLSDGTRVWLNAASSLRYPVSFSGSGERRVELSGEGYFEVAHLAGKPFRVVSAGQTVEVLGTHFNVNAYGDNGRTVTSLARGSVRVDVVGDRENGVGTAANVTLKPGERAVQVGRSVSTGRADLDTELGWKQGMMEFRDARLVDILRSVSRWYDIDIEYRGKASDRRFTGSVPRSADLSVLLKILEYSDVHFLVELKGGSGVKTLVVMP